jgi:hypothetical protein
MNRILVLNIGDYWPEQSRASLRAASHRWGCELIEIVTTLGAPDIFAAKFRAGEFCHPNGRAIYIDADTVVHAECPSPFDLVPQTHLGAVLNYQGDTHRGDHETYQRPSWDKACEMIGSRIPYTAGRYINAGLIVFSACHKEMFHMLRQRVYDTHGVNEQGAFSVAIAERPAVYLPREFNRVGPAVWQSGPQMSAYCYHFANYFEHRGAQNKAARISSTDWQGPRIGAESDTHAPSIPRACAGGEIH